MPTIGTLSGAEAISQSCRQSIRVLRDSRGGRAPSPVRSSEARQFLAGLRRAALGHDSRRRLSPRVTFTFSALSPLTPASLAPVRKCHHLFAHARSAQSSELTRQSEYQCSARYMTAAVRWRLRSSRPTIQNERRYTASCLAAFRTVLHGPGPAWHAPCSFPQSRPRIRADRPATDIQ